MTTEVTYLQQKRTFLPKTSVYNISYSETRAILREKYGLS